MGIAPLFNGADNSWSEKLLYVLYTNFDKPVDTFFVIGGMLATWSILNALNKFVSAFELLILY